MKFKKLLKELSKLPKDIPCKFYHEGMDGDLYLGSGGYIYFVKKGDSHYSNYYFCLDDFKRKDWIMVTR